MKIPISEIFESIQGEGRNVGKPSIFVRFWGCNLHCKWCDSKYSWDAKVEKANIISLDKIINKIKSFKSQHIIFTGGEPTLFQKQILAIQKQLGGDYTYELETNGSIEIIEDITLQQVNISPKLSNSGNKKYKLKILDSRYGLDGNCDLKFVSDGSDFQEIKQVIQDIKNNYIIDGIYIMPLGTTSESQNNKEILNFCIKNGYNYCLRQHIILFGDKKGV